MPGARSSGQDWLLVYAVAAAMGLATFTWLAALASGVLSHGGFADVPWSAAGTALPRLITDPGDPAAAYRAGGGRGVGGPIAFWTCFAVLASGAAAAVHQAARRLRGWSHGGRDGLATRAELNRALSERSALRKAAILRPGMPADQVKVTDVAVACGTAIGARLPLWVPIEDSVALIAPARAGKTQQVVIPALLDWPKGPALVTSARTDVLYATAELRPGPVHVLDPYNVSGWPDPLRWSLVDGCADFGVAQRRTEVLAAATRSDQGTRNGGYFVHNAKILLACWLHAAALDELGTRDVVRWASSPSTRDPIHILAAHGRGDLARTLAVMYEGDNEEQRASWKTAFQPLAGMLNDRIADIFGCPPAESLSLNEWLTGGGTIYLIGEDDDASQLAPLLAAFGRAITDTAKHRAARAPGGRLDPPLGLFGDEIANCLPLPELPKLMSLAGGFGIFILASLQNLAAAEQRWGPLGVRQMFANATVKLVLGGVGDPRELKMLSDVIGDHDQEQHSVSQDDRRVQLSTSTRRSPILDAAALRTAPDGTGVLIHRTTPATRVRFVPAHRGPRAADIAEATRRALHKTTTTTWTKP
ncbi:hypothetical protein BJF79_07445 [Actinomadura sp. CNU-125]|nr:hypothetical protein BJF79_07445 [Actinomadura sp. CNU-125]